jgi:hypothetical protein
MEKIIALLNHLEEKVSIEINEDGFNATFRDVSCKFWIQSGYYYFETFAPAANTIKEFLTQNLLEYTTLEQNLDIYRGKITSISP